MWHRAERVQHPKASPQPSADSEPTLGVVLRGLAARRPPRHLLEGVSVALPWAAYFGYLGLWRAAMLATALGSFGLWAVCDRWARTAPTGWQRAIAAAGRGVTATVTASLLAALVLEVFFKVLGRGPVS
jgi:hypothetical protein